MLSSVDVVGVIDPGARAASEIAAGKRIGGNSDRSNGAEWCLRECDCAASIRAVEVIERACPLFVPLAEEGWADSDVARNVAEHYLGDLREMDVGALVLGCTHYPILRDLISEIVGTDVPLIDSGEAAAREVQTLLESSELGLVRCAERRSRSDNSAMISITST